MYLVTCADQLSSSAANVTLQTSRWAQAQYRIILQQSVDASHCNMFWCQPSLWVLEVDVISRNGGVSNWVHLLKDTYEVLQSTLRYFILLYNYTLITSFSFIWNQAFWIQSTYCWYFNFTLSAGLLPLLYFKWSKVLYFYSISILW